MRQRTHSHLHGSEFEEGLEAEAWEKDQEDPVVASPFDTASETEAADAPASHDEQGAMRAEVERLKASMEDMRLRQAADMENFKKRLHREHQEALRYAAEGVLADLLPTLDNLELALQYGSRDDACKDMMQGVAMTRKLLLDAVAKHGLFPVGEEGERFSPEFHEAVGFEERPDMGAGIVARVLQKGYKLGERLLRPAKVAVTQ